ncbi:MAG TPA: choice-of-anchor Q domain-containing protein [Rhodanobacteraceae bacterium]|nr:choice-of-anchor Q domain-containing protein [Rhodanobacteraceae bacterium]
MSRRFFLLPLAALPLLGVAATFTVTVTDLDLGDIDPGDGECAWATFPPSDQRCTLRAAIIESNALPGADTVIVPFGADIVLDRAGRNEDAGALGDLDITEALIITTPALSSPDQSAVIDADQIDRVLDVRHVSGDVRLHNLRIRGGAADDATTFVGGGIRALNGKLVLAYCDVQNNIANAGGGIYTSGSLEVAFSAIHANATLDLGFANPFGSAIKDSDGGPDPGDAILIHDSSIYANLALFGTGTRAAVDVRTPITLWNSTLAMNVPQALHAYGTTASLNHVTISGSQIGYVFGGNSLAAQSALRNTIIAGNSMQDCRFDGSYGYSHAWTLASDDSCNLAFGPDNLPGVDARLRPLAPRLGRWPVHDLASGSPAIDSADPQLAGAGGSCLGEDQDGVLRPLDGDGDGARCDMGAIEFVDLIFADGFEPPPRRPARTAI